MRRPTIPLACGGDAWSMGVQHDDGTIDVGGFRLHTKTCPVCAVYFDALVAWMGQFDPEPPQARRQNEQE